MLIPDTLFYCIMQDHPLSSLPPINIRSVNGKRWWKNKSEHEKKQFSKLRSEVQSRVWEENPDLKKKFHQGTSRAKKEFWDNISEEDKQAHIKKMSEGMKRAWDEGGEDFGPRVANRENVKVLNGNIELEDDLSRINDYCGVITESQLAQLNG